jgi:Nodulation protein Z (NodZ)
VRRESLRYRAYQRLKLAVVPPLRSGVFSFEIHNPGVGFFAQLNWCANVLTYCHERGLTARLSATSPHYRDPARSSNWLTYFFDVPDVTQPVDFRIAQFWELCMPERYLKLRTIERFHDLVSRHLPLRPEIRSKVDSFCGEHFLGSNILGVHYRGTDKTEEAPRVRWEAIRQAVSNYMDEHPVDAIFGASDEPEFLSYLGTSFPRVPLQSTQSRLAASYKQDLGADNYRKGEEALIDCLLLSRCSVLIRTTSFLSAWASIFNPSLPIILLNRPYPEKLWFPESALIQRSMN